MVLAFVVELRVSKETLLLSVRSKPMCCIEISIVFPLGSVRVSEFVGRKDCLEHVSGGVGAGERQAPD